MLDLPILRILSVVLFSGCELGMLSLRSLAQDSDTGTGISGEHDFRMYCADCHGEDGRGEGPKIFGLSKPPPDLTTLKTRNGGTFPRDLLLRIIDGRETIKDHGDREMPVWGDWFKLEAEEGLGGAEGDEETVRKRIDGLIDFLETIQR